MECVLIKIHAFYYLGDFPVTIQNMLTLLPFQVRGFFSQIFYYLQIKLL